MDRIAAVVVFFNPSSEALLNAISCSLQVEKVIVVDNSERSDRAFLKPILEIDNIRYIHNGQNRGIANALNRGATEASKLGFKWLLTMDQDTALPKDYVATIVSRMSDISDKDVGIIAPTYENSKMIPLNKDESIQSVSNAIPVLFTMTSANLLNLESYQKAGEFLDDLFIDHVDHEYGMRLNAYGYKVYELSDVVLKHQPGLAKDLGKKIKYTSHNPVRLYYFCRNGFKVSALYRRRFPVFRRFFLNLLLRQSIKILLFEDRKIERFKMIIRGYKDFRKDKFGPYNVKHGS
jgi:rhamnosyltransferase